MGGIWNQSVYDETLKFINRGHGTENMEFCITESKKRGLKTCSHIIYGLPNETKEMMLYSLKTVLDWGSDGIKVHPLYIIEKLCWQICMKRESINLLRLMIILI